MGKKEADSNYTNSGDKNVTKKMKSLLTCIICFSIFDEPITTYCGHTFCRECLNKLISSTNTEKKCAICRADISSILPRFHPTSKIIEQLISELPLTKDEKEELEIKKDKKKKIPNTLLYEDVSIFDLTELIVYPGENLDLQIFEKKYCRMLEHCLKRSMIFGVVSKDPNTGKLENFGTLVKIEKYQNISTFYQNRYLIATKGIERFEIVKRLKEKEKNGDSYISCSVKVFDDEKDSEKKILSEELFKLHQFGKTLLEKNKSYIDQLERKFGKLPSIKEPKELSFWVSSILSANYQLKMELLATKNTKERVSKLNQIVQLLA